MCEKEKPGAKDTDEKMLQSLFIHSGFRDMPELSRQVRVSHRILGLTATRENGATEFISVLNGLAAASSWKHLDNRKDQIMTVFKLALTNVVMWTREQYFPPSYAHATWGRLAPFFQLPGMVTSNQHTVSVALRPFNDQRYNRDLSVFCQRVNEKHSHLPDGRLLQFSVKEPGRPILYGQQRLLA